MEVKEASVGYAVESSAPVNTAPPGYKQTEVGVIPEDWSLRPLGDVTTFLDGKRRPVKDADRARMRGPIPYYGASGIVDYVNDYLFDEELILLGEDGENILSRNCRLAFRISGKVWVNNHAHVLKPHPDVSIGFLADYLESLNYERFNSGTAQPKLNKRTCFRIPIALPPTKAEQEAIAEALSDADALIESLQQLIVKKRQIKQGAMQDLLTGQQRLPGFEIKHGYKQTEVGMIPQDWELLTLDSFCDIAAGGDLIKVDYSPTDDQKYPFPIYSNAHTNEGLYGYSTSHQYGPDCITVTARGDVGHAIYRNSRFCAIGRVLVLSSNSACDLRFVTDFINNFVDFANESTGVPQLTAPQISKYTVALPPSKAEQTAIATVLSDMDNEIADLQTRLGKTRDLKQGMMQALLTGRIRLPLDAVSETARDPSLAALTRKV